jgi:REP element-mobilizing transposase RayT
MSYTCLLCHIIFSTKERRPFLQAEELRRTCEYIGGIIRQQGGNMKAANGAAEHVHIATCRPATVGLPDLVRTIKANSSAWIHQSFPDLRAFRWQDGYAGFSVSPSVMPQVVKYIRTQEEHHKKLTFQEELIGLLKAHGVEYDERYIWK